ncbi:hypothetical protein [Mucilaginibacter sp. UYCu711]|uniref:hypothetical protein n=1 Tax=Mucilaginibacter sp. UYCu711 TaxID=3156339 RepID=UPI003D197989
MKELKDNKKKLFALTLFFAMTLTVIVQVKTKADPTSPFLPCKTAQFAIEVHLEKDPDEEVSCKTCTMGSTGTAITNANGQTIGYRYSVSSSTSTLKKYSCHYTNNNTKSCGPTVIAGGNDTCPDHVDIPNSPDTGTAGTTGTGS